MDIKKSMEYKGWQPVYLHTADSSITWILSIIPKNQ